MMITPQSRLSPSQSIGCAGFMSPSDSRSAFSAPSCPRICFTPMAPTNGGRIIGMRMQAPRRDFPGKRYRSLITASGTAIKAVSSVLKIPMRREFQRPSR